MQLAGVVSLAECMCRPNSQGCMHAHAEGSHRIVMLRSAAAVALQGHAMFQEPLTWLYHGWLPPCWSCLAACAAPSKPSRSAAAA